jgi:hypothetical protein
MPSFEGPMRTRLANVTKFTRTQFLEKAPSADLFEIHFVPRKADQGCGGWLKCPLVNGTEEFALLGCEGLG